MAKKELEALWAGTGCWLTVLKLVSPASAHCPGFCCVLLTYFTLWDIHTALGINSPPASLSSTQTPAVLLHLHTALVWIMHLGRTSVPSYAGNLTRTLISGWTSVATAGLFTAFPRWSVKKKSESTGDGRHSGSCLDIETNTTEEVVLMYYQGENFQQQADYLYIIGHYHKALHHLFIF